MKTPAMFVAITVYVLFCLIPGVTPAAGQPATGLMEGLVVDGETGEALIGANVVVAGEAGRPLWGTTTDLDGRYALRLPPGMHRVEFSYISYATRVVEAVSIDAKKPAVLNVSLAPVALAGEEMVVTARAETSSEVSMLAIQQKAGTVTDGISNELMSRASSSDAGDALKRVTGISVVGGKYVFVRGLGERYSNTQLNGVQIPSPEPNRRVVPMDIFPAGLLENIQVAKTFSPEQPGDFSGGSVQIRTREFPSTLTLSASASGSWNSRTQYQNVLTYPGGGTDWLGVDDGTREMPEPIRTQAADQSVRRRGQFSTTGFTAEEVQAFGRSFANVWSPTVKTGPANQGYALSLGNAFPVNGDGEFGFILSSTYGNDWTHSNQEWNSYRITAVDGQEQLSMFTNYDVQTTTNDVLWGTMFNSTYRHSPGHKLLLKTIYNRNSENEGRFYEGYNSDRDTQLRNQRIRFIERGIFSGTFGGEHYFKSLAGSTVEWQGSYSRATRNEPDNREVLYELRDSVFVFFDVTQSGSRLFFDLLDEERGGKLDWTLKAPSPAGGEGKIKFGGLFRDKDRDFHARRFRFQQGSGIQRSVDLSAEPEELFRAEHIGPGLFEVREVTRAADNYSAAQEVQAGYLMADMPLSRRWRFSGGFRVERSRQALVAFDPFTPDAPPTEIVLDNTDVLPGVNLVYALTDRQNVRLAYSRTLARPDFRELAPFEFADFVGGRAVVGNPALVRTTIDNFDLRWETFPRLGELVAVSAFYKSFTDPIEQIIEPTAQLRESYQNAKGARNYGLELEVRRALDLLAPSLSNFSVNANLTLVRSDVQIDPAAGVQTSDERALQGQSPFVVNVTAGYNNADRGTAATVLYNVFGRRISDVGALGLPDVYEEPRHLVDVTFRQRLAPHFSLKLSGKNLLDHRVLYEQGGMIFRRYQAGRSVSAGLSYDL